MGIKAPNNDVSSPVAPSTTIQTAYPYEQVQRPTFMTNVRQHSNYLFTGHLQIKGRKQRKQDNKALSALPPISNAFLLSLNPRFLFAGASRISIGCLSLRSYGTEACMARLLTYQRQQEGFCDGTSTNGTALVPHVIAPNLYLTL